VTAPTLITGASGFFGTHLARAFAESNRPYVALVRRSSDVGPLRALGATTREGDVTDRGSLVAAMRGCGAVVHLAGAADVADAELNEQVNVGGAVNVAEACVEAGVRRLLFFSSNCAVRELQDAYGRTKQQAELELRRFDLDVRVFRPAMIYGEGSREWATFVSTVARLPRVPVPGTGQHLLRPVFVDDAIAATVAALERDGLGGRVYDIVGPDEVTLDDLVQRVARLLGARRKSLHLPLGLCLAGARVLGRVWTHPPVVPDQVLAFAQDTRGDLEPPRRDLDWTPRPLNEGLSLLFARTGWKQMGSPPIA
jgi:nucleoside-diphosphate-sugar epimerase